MPKLYNLRKDKNIPKDAVYIDRRSKWGNPYIIGRDGTREDVIRKHREKCLGDVDFMNEIWRKLEGKDLICWCHPLPCHGDFYLEVANDRAD